MEGAQVTHIYVLVIHDLMALVATMNMVYDDTEGWEQITVRLYGVSNAFYITTGPESSELYVR